MEAATAVDDAGDGALSVTVDLDVHTEAGDAPTRADMERWLDATLGAAGGGRAGGHEIGVRIVAEPESRALNHRYRRKDNATNVLAFPSAGLPPDWPAELAMPLGDLVICAPVVAREAAEQAKDPADHWAHMLVHGMLHLLGHDHQTEAEAARMEALEIRVLTAGGLENPYEDRYPT